MDPEAEILAERDAIFSMLAIAAVHATWDDSPLGEGSGHNIGALLVDKTGTPVAFARNESSGRRDLTEHAELRLIRHRIAASPDRTELHKHAVYSTLEPCAMCAGMMAMTNIRRVVYALPDPIYGGVFDRLKGYPQVPDHAAAPGIASRPLWGAFARSGMPETIRWLPTESAREAFGTVAKAFGAFTASCDANLPALESAREFLATLAP